MLSRKNPKPLLQRSHNRPLISPVLWSWSTQRPFLRVACESPQMKQFSSCWSFIVLNCSSVIPCLYISFRFLADSGFSFQRCKQGLHWLLKPSLMALFKLNCEESFNSLQRLHFFITVNVINLALKMQGELYEISR